MQLSALLGHPEKPHFNQPPPPLHHPPPPTSLPLLTKKKTPSQMRRQERRQREAGKKAAEATAKTHITDGAENILSNSVAQPKQAEIICEAEVVMPPVKLVEHLAEMLSLNFKCEQCDYTNTTEKGLAQHTRMKHRISQVDGNIDSDCEEPKENDKLPLELDETSVNTVSKPFKISSREMKSVEDLEKELLSTNIWKDMDLMSGFSVEDDVQDFNIEVICMRQDFPQKFNVARAVIMLKSLPWPDSISITRSEPLRFLTE